MGPYRTALPLQVLQGRIYLRTRTVWVTYPCYASTVARSYPAKPMGAPKRYLNESVEQYRNTQLM